MKFGKLAALLGLIVSMSGLCRADLLPGDVALTRIQDDVIALMALKPIPAGEKIIISDSNWTNGIFDGSGSNGVFTVPSNLQTGDQQLIDLANIGINLNWGKVLHFAQAISPSHTTDTYIRHLLVVELRRDGLRWISDIPDGLIRDVTHITIREQFDGQGMNHVIKEGLLSQSLRPFVWMRAFGSFRSWTSMDSYISPISLSAWADLKLTVNPAPGIISLPYKAQNYPAEDGEIYGPVRRSFGSNGNAQVTLNAIDKFGPFKRWRNETTSGLNMDFTGVAFGPGIGFVAVAPQSGMILLNEGGEWSPKDINGTGENLQLADITWDGSAFWACSLRGGVYKSGDGVNWSEIHRGQEGDQLFGIQFINGADFRYFAVGANGLALYSQDGGEWIPAEFPSTADFYGVAFFDGRFVLCGSGGTIIHTADPSKTWALSTTPDTKDLFSITPIDLSGTPTLLAVGQYGTMISTDSLEKVFLSRQSNTNQSLFDVIEVQRNGGESKYVFAVGANGATVVATNANGFQTPRFDPRAPALYALVQDPNPEGEPIVYGVGEYGSLTRYDTDGFALSGSLDGLSLDGNGSSTNLSWDTGDSSEKYVKLTKEAALTLFRERILLNLERPAEPGVPYRLGNDESEINFFRSININGGADTVTPVAQNYGTLLNLTGAGLVVISDEEWRLRFRIINTSNRLSQRLFIRFEGTNLPEFDIPDIDTAGPGSTLDPLERTDFITTILRQPVENIALYEEFRSGEVVLKARTAVNSLVANPNWIPNGIFERSLGAYLLDTGSLNDPGIPGIGILGGGGQGAAEPEPQAIEEEGAQPTTESEPMIAYGSGFVFSGTAPTPPANNPESSELVLLSVTAEGAIGMDVRSTYDYFLTGNFYNTGTGLTEDYTMNTVDWAVTESSLPAEGLSIEDDTGTFVADPYPGVAYPRSVSMDAVTTEGAPLDDGGRPVEYRDSIGLSITKPSNTAYVDWATANSLGGDNALQTADPDGDNIINIVEFAFGTDPNIANAMSGVSSSFDPATGIFDYCVTLPNDMPAVTVKVETSTDLSIWTERPMTLDSSDSSTETWCISLNLGTAGFARLKVETY